MLIVLPIFLVMGTIICTYYNFLFNSKLEESKGITNSYVNAIEEENTQLSLKVSALAYNDKFLQLINTYNKSDLNMTDFKITKEIDNILDIFFDYSGDIISLVIFLSNREPFVYKNPPPESKLNDLKKDSWYRQIVKNPEHVIYTDNLTYQKVSGTPAYRYSVAIKPPEKFGGGIEGILVLYRSSLIEHLSQIGNEKNVYVLLGSNGNVIFRNAEQLNRGYLKYKLVIDKVEWTLVNYIDVNEIRKPIFNSILLLLILLTCITIMFIIYLKYQMNRILTPIEEYTQQMPLIEKGDFTVRLKPSDIPELNRMANSFNNMVIEIEKLTEEIKWKEREKRSIEIEALQFQINPHFLSNTLNTIKIMARLIDAESIRETTTCLMKIVSNSFRDPGELNTLSSEITNLKDYIHIMKVRYGDSFWVTIKCEKGLENAKIMKMLIQPLVENAIIHGLVPRDRQGCLFIHFRNNKRKLEIDIVDNGTGIKELSTVLKKKHPHKGLYHIGISNVRDRIKLNYEEGYGITFKSRINRYTKVTLTLPLEKGSIE